MSGPRVTVSGSFICCHLVCSAMPLDHNSYFGSFCDGRSFHNDSVCCHNYHHRRLVYLCPSAFTCKCITQLFFFSSCLETYRIGFHFNMFQSDASVTDDGLLEVSSPGARFSKKVVAAVCVGATILLAPVAIQLSHPSLQQRGTVTSVIQEEQFGSKMAECAATTENCFSNKCCKTTGYSCFLTGASTGKCAKACPAGSACNVVKPWYKALGLGHTGLDFISS